VTLGFFGFERRFADDNRFGLAMRRTALGVSYTSLIGNGLVKKLSSILYPR